MPLNQVLKLSIFALLTGVIIGCSTPARLDANGQQSENRQTNTLSINNVNDFSINKIRQIELIHLLKQDCGSCHGMTLKGGLGPALTVDRMSALPSEYLFKAIWEGREKKAMPPWKTMLKENEVRWLVQKLQQGIN